MPARHPDVMSSQTPKEEVGHGLLEYLGKVKILQNRNSGGSYHTANSRCSVNGQRRERTGIHRLTYRRQPGSLRRRVLRLRALFRSVRL